MISIKNLTKAYRNELALDNISLELKSERLVSFVGPNGSGKTTLMKIILGLVYPTSGEVIINRDEAYIGYMPEVSDIHKSFRTSTVIELMKRALLGDGSKNHYIENIIDLMDMSGYLNKKIGSLSKGMQKKASLLIAFCNSPNLVVLDEPFEGIDTLDRDRLMGFLESYISDGNTIILSTHILHDLDKVCRQAVFLKKGDLVLQFDPATSNSFTFGGALPESVRNMFVNSSTTPTITDIYRELYK